MWIKESIGARIVSNILVLFNHSVRIRIAFDSMCIISIVIV